MPAELPADASTLPAGVDEKPSFLERWGAGMLAQQPASLASPPSPASPASNPVHVLDADEHAALLRIERDAVLRAALAGALSALASGVAEVLLGRRFDLAHATFADLAAFSSLYGLVTLVASVLEIAFLYVDALRSVRRLAQVSGLELTYPVDDAHAIARALARAALELPDPHHPVLGVDPRREASRARLVLASLVYKGKIGLTSFLAKAVLRRALGRLATRQLLAFAAVPVNALWNALVTFQVLREARVRAMGPSAVEALLPSVLPDPARLSEAARRTVARAAASAIVRTESAHPNLVVFLRRVLDRLGPFEDRVTLDDTGHFLAELETLDGEERGVALRVLTVASLLDGRLVAREKRLLREALSLSAAGEPRLAPASIRETIAAVDAKRRAFVRGEPFEL